MALILPPLSSRFSGLLINLFLAGVLFFNLLFTLPFRLFFQLFFRLLLSRKRPIFDQRRRIVSRQYARLCRLFFRLDQTGQQQYDAISITMNLVILTDLDSPAAIPCYETMPERSAETAHTPRHQATRPRNFSRVSMS